MRSYTVLVFFFLAYFTLYNRLQFHPVLTIASGPADFSGGRSGGLVFPSLSEFFTVYCDPYSQTFSHSQ